MSKKLKMLAWFIAGCMMQVSIHAADAEHDNALKAAPVSSQALARSITHTVLPDDSLTAARDRRLAMEAALHPQRGNLLPQPMRNSPFALAIGRAAKKGIVERSSEGYTEVLIQCQKGTSPASTTAPMRSESLRDHCFSY